MSAQDEQHLYSLPYEHVPMASNNYADLENKPKINNVTLVGNKSLSDLGIPTKTSELTNDAGFITASAVPTKTSELTNDAGFATETYVGNAVGALETLLEPLDGAYVVKNPLLESQFTSTFDNLATSLTTALSTIKAALNTTEYVELKSLKINTIGNVKPTTAIIITPSTDVLELIIDWQGFTYNNNVVQAIDIVNKKLLSLTMTNDLNDDAFVSYFEDTTVYTFTLVYTKYIQVNLTEGG